jgi:transcriptional regulator with XRE-family HTH domain
MSRAMGVRLRQLRILKGLSQAQLGEKLGVTFQQIQKYESGTNVISPWKLQRVAEELGVAVAYFFEQVETKGRKASREDSQMMMLMRRLREIQENDPALFRAICRLAGPLLNGKE